MLDRRVPVEEERQVHLQISAPFRNDFDPLLAGGLDDPLPLHPSGLHVGLHGEGAEGLHPADVVPGVVERVDDGPVRIVRSVQDEAGREDPRPGHQTGLDHLRLAEGLLRAGGGIVCRRDAVGEVREVLPGSLGEDVER